MFSGRLLGPWGSDSLMFANITQGRAEGGRRVGRGVQHREFSAAGSRAHTLSSALGPDCLPLSGSVALGEELFLSGQASVFSSAYHTGLISPSAPCAIFSVLNATRLAPASQPFHWLSPLCTTPLPGLRLQCPSLPFRVTSSESLPVAFSPSPHLLSLVPATL